MHTCPTARSRSAGRLIALAALLSATASAVSGPLPVATDLRVLLRQAIDSPTGTASAELRTPEAQALTQQVGMRTPVLVDVATETVYAEEGCRRLRVTFILKGVVLTPGAASQNRAMQYGLNYCRDGRPPRSLAVQGSR